MRGIITYVQCPQCGKWIRSEVAYKEDMQGVSIYKCTICKNLFADFECKFKVTDLMGRRIK